MSQIFTEDLQKLRAIPLESLRLRTLPFLSAGQLRPTKLRSFKHFLESTTRRERTRGEGNERDPRRNNNTNPTAKPLCPLFDPQQRSSLRSGPGLLGKSAFACITLSTRNRSACLALHHDAQPLHQPEAQREARP